jgi:hypothetical protein
LIWNSEVLELIFELPIYREFVSKALPQRKQRATTEETKSYNRRNKELQKKKQRATIKKEKHSLNGCIALQ